MSDLAMSPDSNDLLYQNGDLSLVTGTAAIQQDLQQVLQVWAGEMVPRYHAGYPVSPADSRKES